MRGMAPRLPLLATSLLASAAIAACDRPARVELDPPSLRFHGRGQSAPLRATVRGASGKVLPTASCRWSSSDERVAAVTGRQRDAAVVAQGPGTASVRCDAGGAEASAPVAVRIASRVEVSPARLELKLADEPAPVGLEVKVLDTEGRPFQDRPVSTACEDERVCRGDDRGQVWPVGAGETHVVVQVDEAKAAVALRVVDARTASGKPRRVEGNPMLDVEKALAPPKR